MHDFSSLQSSVRHAGGSVSGVPSGQSSVKSGVLSVQCRVPSIKCHSVNAEFCRAGVIECVVLPGAVYRWGKEGLEPAYRPKDPKVHVLEEYIFSKNTMVIHGLWSIATYLSFNPPGLKFVFSPVPSVKMNL